MSNEFINKVCLWGLCKEHGRAASQAWHDRQVGNFLGHAIMCVAEFFPFVSQIISLVDYALAELSTSNPSNSPSLNNRVAKILPEQVQELKSQIIDLSNQIKESRKQIGADQQKLTHVQQELLQQEQSYSEILRSKDKELNETKQQLAITEARLCKQEDEQLRQLAAVSKEKSTPIAAQKEINWEGLLSYLQQLPFLGKSNVIQRLTKENIAEMLQQRPSFNGSSTSAQVTVIEYAQSKPLLKDCETFILFLLRQKLLNKPVYVVVSSVDNTFTPKILREMRDFGLIDNNYRLATEADAYQYLHEQLILIQHAKQGINKNIKIQAIAKKDITDFILSFKKKYQEAKQEQAKILKEKVDLINDLNASIVVLATPFQTNCISQYVRVNCLASSYFKRDFHDFFTACCEACDNNGLLTDEQIKKLLSNLPQEA